MAHTPLPVVAADLARTYRSQNHGSDRRRTDAEHGVRTAEENRWLPLDYDREAFGPLNRLVAWVLSGGSIDERYIPTFVADTRSDRHRLVGLFDDLGIDYRVTEGDRTPTTRYRPAVDAAVLGRLLSVLGAPVGSATDGPLALPDYLDGAPRRVRREFTETYLRSRQRTTEAGDSVRPREGAAAHRHELAAFIEVVNERAAVSEE